MDSLQRLVLDDAVDEPRLEPFLSRELLGVKHHISVVLQVIHLPLYDSIHAWRQRHSQLNLITAERRILVDMDFVETKGQHATTSVGRTLHQTEGRTVEGDKPTIEADYFQHEEGPILRLQGCHEGKVQAA